MTTTKSLGLTGGNRSIRLSLTDSLTDLHVFLLSIKKIGEEPCSNGDKFWVFQIENLVIKNLKRPMYKAYRKEPIR